MSGTTRMRAFSAIAIAPRSLAKGFDVRAIRAPDLDGAMDPFLACDVFEMAVPHFPPHPHAGFSAVTYMLPGSAGGFVNRDSRGDHSLIHPGDVHWTEAARGMMHEETPIEIGTVARGLQLFVDLPAAHKLDEPRVHHVAADAIPRLAFGEATARVISDGGLYGAAAVVSSTRCVLVDLDIPPDGIAVLPVPSAWNLFGLRVEGSLAIESAQTIGEPLALLKPNGTGERVVLEAGATGARVVMLGGPPLQQPLVYGGPFVMSTPEQLTDARRRFTSGAMGRLTPSFST